jgi:NADH/NAD ratio-sensing transcriptional regulator Rex
MKMDIVDITYNVDKDNYTFRIGIFDEQDEMIGMLTQNISIQDAKKMPNFDMISKVLEAVKKETMAKLN